MNPGAVVAGGRGKLADLAALAAFTLTALVAVAALSGCQREGDASPCHEVRKCITLSCKERFSRGRNSEAFTSCVEWCRTSRGVAVGEYAYCAEQIGVTCIQDWYSLDCVRARSRCFEGDYRDTKDGGC